MYQEPEKNRGDKDPDNIISDRLKLYGNNFSIYDNDNIENSYNITTNGNINKIIEIKRADIDKEGIVHAPLVKFGQLQFLHLNWYPAFLAFCIVKRKETGEEYFNYLVSAINYRAGYEKEYSNAILLTEKEFAEFIQPTPGIISDKVLDVSLDGKIKEYRLYRGRQDYFAYKIIPYNDPVAVEKLLLKNKINQEDPENYMRKIEEKYRQKYKELYVSAL